MGQRRSADDGDSWGCLRHFLVARNDGPEGGSRQSARVSNVVGFQQSFVQRTARPVELETGGDLQSRWLARTRFGFAQDLAHRDTGGPDRQRIVLLVVRDMGRADLGGGFV